MIAHGIVANNVSKKFRRGELHDSLRDLVPALAKRLLGRAPAKGQLGGREFWAVRDVSFEVKPGEALGIIGPNGAGKSTMLKLLTKILRPTLGGIEVRGRVAALIEIAGGFHPDLTGRENVYLQGAILGMRRSETRRRFDQIVDFSGIASFIDTPVKRYSSGMHARLGFSIAAHLEPDVLMIDEILAVGDWKFQAKAFDRIRELVTDAGIPVVIVSHQLERVAALCTSGLLLDKGQVMCQGSPDECISAHILGDWKGRLDDDTSPINLQSVSVVSPQPVPSGGAVSVRVSALVSDPDASTWCSIAARVRSISAQQFVYHWDTGDIGIDLPSEGSFELQIDLDFNVPSGLYSVEIMVRSFRDGQVVSRAPPVTVHVKGGPAFLGTVQMNARAHLKDPTGVVHGNDS